MADTDPGWELYRSFLAVMREGSLSGAARLGTLPFVLSDLVKVPLVALILKPTVSPLRERPRRRRSRVQEEGENP